MNFYNKFVNLCNEIGKKPSAVAEEIGLSKSLVTRWKNGGGVTDATAAKVAAYFDVELIDLVGEEEPYNPELSPEEDEDLLEFEEELQIMRDDPATRALLKSGRGLTKEQINAVTLIMKQMRRGTVDDS